MNVKEAWENNLIKINKEFECSYSYLKYRTKLIIVDGDWLYDEQGDLFKGIFLLDVDTGVILCDIDDAYIFEIFL